MVLDLQIRIVNRKSNCSLEEWMVTAWKTWSLTCLRKVSSTLAILIRITKSGWRNLLLRWSILIHRLHLMMKKTIIFGKAKNLSLMNTKKSNLGLKRSIIWKRKCLEPLHRLSEKIEYGGGWLELLGLTKIDLIWEIW